MVMSSSLRLLSPACPALLPTYCMNMYIFAWSGGQFNQSLNSFACLQYRKLDGIVLRLAVGLLLKKTVESPTGRPHSSVAGLHLFSISKGSMSIKAFMYGMFRYYNNGEYIYLYKK